MKKLCAFLLAVLMCFGCMTACGSRAQKAVDNTEKLILSSLLGEVEEILGSYENNEVVSKAKEVLNNRSATSSDITQITSELQKLKEEYLNKPIVFVDNALERFVKKSLGKSFVDFVTVAEARNITEFDFTYDAQNTDAMLQITNIDDFARFPKLKKLVLKNNKITDISSLSALTELTELDISQNEIADLSPLSGLTNLTKLNFAENKVENLLSLGSALVQLTQLDASNNPLASFGALQDATSLISLKLDGYTFSTFDFIYSLEKLETLSLCKTSLQGSQLKNLIYIKNLDISLASGVDAADLSLLTGLKTLVYRNAGLTDASFISEMTNLTSIDFSQNELKSFDFPKTVQGLRSVNLSQNSLETLAVPSFTGLEELDLSKNELASLLLQRQPALKTLKLASNKLSQIDFSALPNLQALDMSENAVLETTFISSETLKELSLQGNGVAFFNAYAPALQELNLANNSSFVPASLSGWTALTSLNLLGSAAQLTDLSFLSPMTGLRELSLDLSFLENKSLPVTATSLEELTVGGADDSTIFSIGSFSRLKSLSVVSGTLSSPQLSGLKYLSALSISSPTLSDISGIKNLEGLSQLSITGASLSSPSVSGFAKLRKLSIISSGVEDVSHIENLPLLQYLNLSSNAPKGFVFALLPSLSYLSLSSCGISYISDFYLSVSDCVIDLSGNKLTELSGLMRLHKILVLNISDNPVLDYSALDGITVTKVIK